ncbi:hypothetical protein BKE38_19945 [Pseudoroseomonas deserti]|uniref:Uncharacterized protein n=1 Tax=Teichococcus deserti TaxID=1817963 RepID=A0A1V2GYL5_9PROT|nr:hypothetical protein [Pseudoroseomonas deserti]ONG50021.1 hypothetical protein BKE38_19945 [Pseudoroseomonas deserti]
MRAAALAFLLLTAAAPALGQPAPTAEARRSELNRLLDALPSAPDATAASALEARIRGLWAQGASPAVMLLLRRGARNMESEAPADAVEDFDAALTLQPDHAESWLLRAQAQAATGDMQAALADLRQVLVLEPRHFGALAVLSGFQEQMGDNQGALRSMQEAVTINPRLSGGAERLKRLHAKVHGEDA